MSKVEAVEAWSPARLPERTTFIGAFVRLEPLRPSHALHLYEALAGPKADPLTWNHMFYGPFSSLEDFEAWIRDYTQNNDPFFWAVINKQTGRAVGFFAFLRITPDHGVTEIGHIVFTSAMQRTPMSTEAVYLLMRYAIELGNRRVEWKCDNDNSRSRAAALRFGFKEEGIFRQHMVVKGRNRNTAWFAFCDFEWARLEKAFMTWLESTNFDADGKQIKTLEQCRLQ
ncbi:hypothetical protein YB2330_004027 [Saitoella coloradoensis]